jgi:hypothetical protein
MFGKRGFVGLLTVLTVAAWTGSAESAANRKVKGSIPASPARTALAKLEPVRYYSRRYPRRYYRRHNRRYYRSYYYGRYRYSYPRYYYRSYYYRPYWCY